MLSAKWDAEISTGT